MGFLHRHPFSTDAYELGYAVGVREDYTFVDGSYPNIDLPVVILDNYFRDPDIDRYLDRFETLDPSIAILGDAQTPRESEALNRIALDLKEAYPYKEFVIVPKCPGAVDVVDEDLALGYAMGYSDVQAGEVADLNAWRGRKVHLLGGSPPKQYTVIEALTQPTLTDQPPADIVGLDWNGLQKIAYLGEYWSPDGWQRADQLSIRDTVRKSLQEMKTYWQDRDVWPETEPIDLYGPAVQEPDDPVFATNAMDIASREQLESAVVVEHETYGTLAFQNETDRRWFEYSEGLPGFWEG